MMTTHNLNHQLNLRLNFLDTFPEDISNTQDFQVGYFEPPGSTKRWILSNRDYSSHVHYI